MSEYEIVVVGGGAAGLSAALVLTRARRRVAVIDAGAPRNAAAAHMQGFLSRDGMSPADFLAAGRTEILGYGGELLTDTVVSITPLSPVPPSAPGASTVEAGLQAPASGPGASMAKTGLQVPASEPGGPTVKADFPVPASGPGAPVASAGFRVPVSRSGGPTVNAGFKVRLASGRVLTARRVLVATGLRDELPAIPGLAERWGRDVLHCPYCHGHEVRDRPLGVLGGSPEAVGHALLVRQWSDDVVFFAHTHRLTGDERQRLTVRGIRIVEGAVTRVIVDDDRLAGIELDWASMVAPHALFVRPELVPSDSLLTGLGAAVVSERTGRTSVPGIWAAGNAVDPRAQVITAAGAGSAAAIDLHADLVDEDVRDALPFSAAMERQVAALSFVSV